MALASDDEHCACHETEPCVEAEQPFHVEMRVPRNKKLGKHDRRQHGDK